ncbi:MAG: uracil phosphoribosyltransferase [Bacteroidetes bacterium]|nr:MAG: uracil phosphoribosyltransferase [Bacteroidota bacterium]
MIYNFAESNSLINQFISEIRNVDVQNDRLRFRRNMERIGEVFAYEISKVLEYSAQDIETPLGVAKMNLVSNQPIIASIMRAGIPLHIGLLNFFDKADNAFISAYRRHHKNGEFEIELEYVSCPNIDGKVLILVDPMLASGKSMELSYKALMRYGKPKHVHIVSAIASTEGVNFLKKNINLKDVTLWFGAIDGEMTAQSYIVPGLGDAGDLSFGEKIHLD